MTDGNAFSVISLKMQGCDADYKDALVVLFGAPFDGTVSFRPGSRFGPQAMRQDSIGLETYSPYQNTDLSSSLTSDIGDLDLPMGDPEGSLAIIKNTTDKIAAAGKIPLMLGGEHLVTLPVFESLLEKYPDLCLIHLDAHADLREDYLGVELSHATVVRRIWDLVGDGRIFQMGIRSGTVDEFAFARNGHTSFYPLSFDNSDQIAAEIGNRPVYLTIDLDVYDPAVFPGTGTPEPGGILFPDMIRTLNDFSGLHIVGADLVELAPHYDASAVSTALALKTMRELLVLIQNQYSGRQKPTI